MRVGSVAAALAIAACGGAEEPELTFEYRATAEPGFMDQTLAIENPGGTGLAPVLELTPLDASGEPMAGVRVRTAYGSDSGRLVVPPRTAVVDVLRFEGRGARDVEDVRVDVGEVDEVDAGTITEEAVVQRLDRAGRPVEDFEPFHAFRVSNENDAEIDVRVVVIEWEQPPPGESQQAIRVTPVSSLLSIAPGGQETVRLPPELRGRVVGSVKAYPSR